MRLSTSILGLLITLIPLCGIAAEQGKLAPQSKARFSISLAIQPSMQIKTVSDISLNINDRSMDASFSKPFCVQGSINDKYTIVAYGTNKNADTFVLRNSENDKLPYHVSFRGDPASSNYDPLLPGVPSKVYDVLDRGISCEDKTGFKVIFRAGDLQTAGSGLYTGSLTLLVSPV